MIELRRNLSALAALWLACGVGCATNTGQTEAEVASEALSCAVGFNRRYTLPVPAALPQRYASGVSCEVPGYGYLTTATLNDGDDDAFLLLVDANGAPLRGFRYGDDREQLSVSSIVASHEDGHVIVTGRRDDQLWVAKIRMPSGAIVWSRSVGVAGWGEEGTFVRTLPPDSAGERDYLVVGRIYDVFWNFAYLTRISDDGTLRWARRYDDTAAAFPTRDYETVAIGEGPVVMVAGIRNELSAPASRDFSILRVRVSTGDVQPDTFYYPHDDPNALAERTPHMVRTAAGYVATFGVRPGGGFQAVALFLSPTLAIDHAQWMRSPGGFDLGHSVFYDGELRVSTTADGEAGFLTMAADGTVLGHSVYGHVGEVSPMTAVSHGYLLRSTAGTSLSLTHTDSVGGSCCRDAIHHRQERIPMHRETTTYGSAAWGVLAAAPVVGPRPVRVASDACR